MAIAARRKPQSSHIATRSAAIPSAPCTSASCTAVDPALGAGEREAISLAYTSAPDTILLIDERLGRSEAQRLGLKVAGTLAILQQAHEHGLLDFLTALTRLRATNFKATAALLKKFTDRA